MATDTSGSGSINSGQLSLGYYVDSVKVDGSLPYSQAAFWGRNASIELGAWLVEQEDQNLIVAGRVLNKAETDGSFARVRISSPAHDLWLGLESKYTSPWEYSFLGSTTKVELDSQLDYAATLGFYPEERMNVGIKYGRHDQHNKVYGVMFNWLSSNFDGQAIGLDLGYETINYSNRQALTVVNGLVISQVNAYAKTKIWSAAFNYFPVPAVELSVDFEHEKSGRDKEQTLGLSGSYFVTKSLEASLRYSRYDSPGVDRGFLPDLRTIEVGVEYRF